MARAYLWKGDTENAKRYAGEIIDLMESSASSLPFSWINPSSVASGADRKNQDRIFSSEHIFNLVIDDWEDTSNNYLTENASIKIFKPGNAKTDEIFETNRGLGNDYRRLDGVGYTIIGEDYYPCKLWYVEGSAYNNLVPLIRLTEMYYIMAECLKDTDPARAIELLETVRSNRIPDVTPLSTTLTADQIQEEIFKEYRKEFLQEGQLFYYYKRRNEANIPGASVTPTKNVYVIPLPESENQFGYQN